jgi:hypothetical protein
MLIKTHRCHLLPLAAFVVVSSLAAGVAAQGQPPAAPPPAPPAAAPATPPPMPKPAKEFEDFMKGFDGTWKCDTKWPAGAMGPGSPEATVKTTVKFKKELDGFFYRGDYDVKKQKGSPAMKGVFYVGYDPGTSQIVVNSMDSMGGAAFGTGKIEGDKVTYLSDGYAMGMKVKMREEMAKTGPKAAYHKIEIDMGKGFQLMAEDTCKR